MRISSRWLFYFPYNTFFHSPFRLLLLYFIYYYFCLFFFHTPLLPYCNKSKPENLFVKRFYQLFVTLRGRTHFLECVRCYCYPISTSSLHIDYHTPRHTCANEVSWIIIFFLHTNN